MTTPTDPRTTQSYVPHGNVPPIWAGTQPQPTLPDPGIPEKQPDKRNWFARHKGRLFEGGRHVRGRQGRSVRDRIEEAM